MLKRRKTVEAEELIEMGKQLFSSNYPSSFIIKPQKPKPTMYELVETLIEEVRILRAEINPQTGLQKKEKNNE